MKMKFKKNNKNEIVFFIYLDLDFYIFTDLEYICICDIFSRISFDQE